METSTSEMFARGAIHVGARTKAKARSKPVPQRRIKPRDTRCYCEVPFICPAFATSIIALFIIFIGACMGIVGYYAEPLSLKNLTDPDIVWNYVLKKDSSMLKGVPYNQGLREFLKSLSYVGPILAGCGCFLIVISCVVVCEAREKRIKEKYQDGENLERKKREVLYDVAIRKHRSKDAPPSKGALTDKINHILSNKSSRRSSVQSNYSNISRALKKIPMELFNVEDDNLRLMRKFSISTSSDLGTEPKSPVSGQFEIPQINSAKNDKNNQVTNNSDSGNKPSLRKVTKLPPLRLPMSKTIHQPNFLPPIKNLYAHEQFSNTLPTSIDMTQLATETSCKEQPSSSVVHHAAIHCPMVIVQPVADNTLQESETQREERTEKCIILNDSNKHFEMESVGKDITSRTNENKIEKLSVEINTKNAPVITNNSFETEELENAKTRKILYRQDATETESVPNDVGNLQDRHQVIKTQATF